MKLRQAVMGVGAVAVAGVFVALGVGSDAGSPATKAADAPGGAETPLVSPTSPPTTIAVRSGRPMLVVYDTSGEHADVGRADSIMSANLLGRFGPVTRLPIQEYTTGLMADYEGVVYEGSSFGEPIPAAFLDDVAAGTTPVVWAGLNLGQMGERMTSYGFVAEAPEDRAMTAVRYQGVELPRREAGAQITSISVTDPEIATPLGQMIAEDGGEAIWGVSSRALTYVAESPYTFMSEGDRYLAWCDVLIEAFDPGIREQHRALVRLEDISPASDPELLRASINVLATRNIPFAMAVYPLYMDPLGAHGVAYGSGAEPALRLDQRPAVVSAIKYGLEHGGVVVSHGLTHQYEDLPNPYDGGSGGDFEFYRATVDAATDNVVLHGPVPKDSVDWAVDRLRTARSLLEQAGIPLTDVPMFEVPHYAASDATYRAIGQVYDGLNGARPPTRFERGMYFPTTTPDGAVDATGAFGQFYPYPVIDTYGHLIVPENLGNVIEVGYNNHPARTPEDIVDAARRSMVVRDGVVGFFFHPYLDASLLAEVVDGIDEAGYDFVSATAVDTGWRTEPTR